MSEPSPTWNGEQTPATNALLARLTDMGNGLPALWAVCAAGTALLSAIDAAGDQLYIGRIVSQMRELREALRAAEEKRG